MRAQARPSWLLPPPAPGHHAWPTVPDGDAHRAELRVEITEVAARRSRTELELLGEVHEIHRVRLDRRAGSAAVNEAPPERLLQRLDPARGGRHRDAERLLRGGEASTAVHGQEHAERSRDDGVRILAELEERRT